MMSGARKLVAEEHEKASKKVIKQLTLEKC